MFGLSSRVMNRAVTGVFLFVFLGLAPACKERNPEPAEQVAPATPAPSAAPAASTPPAPTPAPVPPQLVGLVRMDDDSHAFQLTAGFFDREEADWRWTGPAFSTKLPVPNNVSDKGAILRFDFALPKPLVAQHPTVVVKARVGEAQVSKPYSGAGNHTIELTIPRAQLSTDAVVAEFSIDKPFLPGGTDSRVLGVIAKSVELASK
jgi:hypothetical protein